MTRSTIASSASTDETALVHASSRGLLDLSAHATVATSSKVSLATGCPHPTACILVGMSRGLSLLFSALLIVLVQSLLAVESGHGARRSKLKPLRESHKVVPIPDITPLRPCVRLGDAASANDFSRTRTARAEGKQPNSPGHRDGTLSFSRKGTGPHDARTIVLRIRSRHVSLFSSTKYTGSIICPMIARDAEQGRTPLIRAFRVEASRLRMSLQARFETHSSITQFNLKPLSLVQPTKSKSESYVGFVVTVICSSKSSLNPQARSCPSFHGCGPDSFSHGLLSRPSNCDRQLRVAPGDCVADQS